MRGTSSVARVAQRVAGVERFEPRQLFGVGLDQVGQLQQDAAAVGGGHAAPGRERTRRGGDRTVDVLAPGHRHLGDGRVVVRVQRRQRLARCGVDEAAVDEELVADRRA